MPSSSCVQRYSRDGYRLRPHLDTDFGDAQNVAIPRGAGSPPRCDDVAVVVMFVDLEDGLSALAGDAANVVQEQKSATE